MPLKLSFRIFENPLNALSSIDFIYLDCKFISMELSLKPQLFNTEFVNIPSNDSCQLIWDTNDKDRVSFNKRSKSKKTILKLFIFNEFKFKIIQLKKKVKIHI